MDLNRTARTSFIIGGLAMLVVIGFGVWGFFNDRQQYVEVAVGMIILAAIVLSIGYFARLPFERRRRAGRG